MVTTADDLARKLDRIRTLLLEDERSSDSLDQVWSDLERIEQRLEASSDEPLHSVLELRGLGKEIWQDIDTEEYIREERASWR